MAGHPALGRVFCIPVGQWVRVGTGGWKTGRGVAGGTAPLARGGGGGCRAAAEGLVCGEGVCGGEEGRLCQPSSKGN